MGIPNVLLRDIGWGIRNPLREGRCGPGWNSVQNTLDSSNQLIELKRLQHKILNLELLEIFPRLRSARFGHDHNRQAMVLFPNMPQESLSLDRGHPEIHEDQIRGVVRDHIQGLGPTGSPPSFEIARPKSPLNPVQNNRFIVQYQNTFAIFEFHSKVTFPSWFTSGPYSLTLFGYATFVPSESNRFIIIFNNLL